MSSPRKITRTTEGGRMIGSNENVLRTVCKRCRRTIYAWQATVWGSGLVLGLCHANLEDCEE